MILWVNGVWFYDFMILWCSTLWSNDSWFYDYWLKFKRVIDDYGVIPSGPFERSSKECWAALKRIRGGKTPTKSWSRNFKPPPKPQTDVFGRVVPYIYRPIYGGKLRQGGPGRGVNLVKIKKTKNRVNSWERFSDLVFLAKKVVMWGLVWNETYLRMGWPRRCHEVFRQAVGDQVIMVCC